MENIDFTANIIIIVILIVLLIWIIYKVFNTCSCNSEHFGQLKQYNDSTEKIEEDDNKCGLGCCNKKYPEECTLKNNYCMNITEDQSTFLLTRGGNAS